MAATQSDRPMIPVDYVHSANLADVLTRLNLSVLISTYQAGKVITLGTLRGQLQVRLHHFDQAMGMARTPRGIAVGSRRQIWFLDGAPELAPRIQPEGTYDLALLTRRSHFTGPMMGHEMGWSNGELWICNTGFSCLCTIGEHYNFVPRWSPPFISKLAPEDRCHLNGLAMEADGPRYVTVLSETDVAGGWRPTKATSGCIIDVKTNQAVARGLCMPHSPRSHQGQLLFLNSGRGEVARVDRSNGQAESIASLDGYCRGLDLHGQYAFVGLSRVRETSVFGGLPIAERKSELCCGMAIVDLSSGNVLAMMRFTSGVEEVFEVKVLPGFRNPILSGPIPDEDQTEMIWLSPPLAT